MSFARLLIAAFVACLLGASPAVATPLAPTAKDLTRAPAISDVSVSPDGEHLAALTSKDGETVYVSVWKTDALGAPPVVIHMTNVRFLAVRFLKNDRLWSRPSSRSRSTARGCI